MGGLVGRREWSIPLVLAASLVVGVGWGALRFSSGTFALDQYFPYGPWRWLLWATACSVAVALILTLIDASGSTRRAAHLVVYDGSRVPSLTQTIEELRELATRLLAGADPDIGRFVDEALRAAMSVGASDVHVTPHATGAQLTFRVDGSLCEVVPLTTAAASRIVQRTKALAELDLSGLRPQDGGLERALGSFIVRARVSILPVQHGERLVLRLVRGSDALPPLDGLGLSPRVLQNLLEILEKNQGILYVSGPVGSGKTTTLYSALAEIHRRRGAMTSLVSLEDPIEQELSFVTQTPINPRTGLGFSQALRSALRQDPGALMIGEVRDVETAEVAVRAGLTGHLLLTTLHVDSAPATFSRLIDMGLSPVLVADSCAGALAQRLVRRLCEHCKAQAEPQAAQIVRLRHLGVDKISAAYFVPVGCDVCEGRGYAGRKLIAEILLLSPRMRRVVASGANTERLREMAIEEGMIPLVKVALEVADRGDTSLSEVLRVCA